MGCILVGRFEIVINEALFNVLLYSKCNRMCHTFDSKRTHHLITFYVLKIV